MPVLDKSLQELETYTGTNPKPADFDEYWLLALRELETTDPEPELRPAESIRPANSEAFDLFFTGEFSPDDLAGIAAGRRPAFQHARSSLEPPSCRS